MNFKVFGAARNRNSGALVKPKSFFLAPHKRHHEGVVIELTAFSEALAQSVNNDTVNSFIAKTFTQHNEFESERVLVESFADFFQNFDHYCNEDDFFPIFYSICLNHNLIKEDTFSDILLLACIAFFNYKINVYRPWFSILDELIQNLPLSLVEDAVYENMIDILEDSNLRLIDLNYLTYFDSWRRKINENSKIAIQTALSFENGIEKFIQLFPELTAEVYEYIFEKTLVNDKNIWTFTDTYDFDFIDSILKPMADLEKYQGCYFKIVREKVSEILKYLCCHGQYVSLYHATNFLIEEFKISEVEVACIYQKCLHDSIETVCQLLDIASITHLLCIAEAYDYFLENLPYLLSEYGISLYAILLKLLGPITAITSKEFCCKEYLEQ